MRKKAKSKKPERVMSSVWSPALDAMLDRLEAGDNPKRGRGRPRKLPITEAVAEVPGVDGEIRESFTRHDIEREARLYREAKAEASAGVEDRLFDAYKDEAWIARREVELLAAKLGATFAHAAMIRDGVRGLASVGKQAMYRDLGLPNPTRVKGGHASRHRSKTK